MIQNGKQWMTAEDLVGLCQEKHYILAWPKRMLKLGCRTKRMRIKGATAWHVC